MPIGPGQGIYVTVGTDLIICVARCPAISVKIDT
jgi:hypothetical protein